MYCVIKIHRQKAWDEVVAPSDYVPELKYNNERLLQHDDLPY